ncbi:hypothetical protein BT96DRAFT_873655 [Gymnopus androsaceus JB14]|uniref:Uncharacterized protein n=1 Tax=Gymnopus androsaceus JB14 TaxID=1447944 RepID=A0A6A4IH41_9AGAR|nr:hypothetical protein BT96DRAFT_873655 [Gymnopus androsaceus JB14]
MDFVQGLDPSKLVLFGAAFSFFLSGFSAPPYNLPIFLFGIYAQENAEAFVSLQAFTALLGASVFYDVIWMIRNEQNGFIKLLTVLLLLVKLPTILAFGLAARQRGAQFGLGIRGSDINGPTVWAMPGGFTSGRDGYQNVDDEPPVHQPRATAPPPPAHPAPTQAAPGAYQTV